MIVALPACLPRIYLVLILSLLSTTIFSFFVCLRLQIIGELERETKAARDRAAEVKARRQREEARTRDRLKAAFLQKQLQRLKSDRQRGGGAGAGAAEERRRREGKSERPD